MRLKGWLYEPQSSRRLEAWLAVDTQGLLHIDGEEGSCGAAGDLQLPPRVGDSARFFRLPDGRGFETADNAQLEKLLGHYQRAGAARLHRLESSALAIGLSLCAAVLLIYLLVTAGIPAAGDYAAKRLPDDVRLRIGEATLEQLDNRVLDESQLPVSRQRELEQLFESLARDASVSSARRIAFRSGKDIGVNALALPDGTVVVTDELVALARDDRQLAAVLLHELGHLEQDHGLRSVMRQTGISLLVLLVSGDVGTASSLVIMLPTALMTLQYSRDFEREADRFALDRMLALDIDPQAFVEIIGLLDARAGRDGEEGAGLLDYITSHPASEERIALFEAARSSAGQGPGQ